MYSIEMPWWLSVFAVVALVAMAAWVFYKDSSPRPLGLMGVVIAGLTSATWFTHLPLWTVFAVVVTAVTLFAVGMFRPEGRDDYWHYAALTVGVLGKALCAFLPWLVEELSGNIEVPKWLIVTLGIATVAAFAYLAFRARKGLWRKSKATLPSPPPEEQVVEPDANEDGSREENQSPSPS